MKNKLKITIQVIIIFGVVIMFVNQSCSSSVYSSDDRNLSLIKQSPNYKNDKFVNYKSKPDFSFGDIITTSWDMLFNKVESKPEFPIPSMKVDKQKINTKEKNILQATWLGHSSLIINIDGKIILTDPVFEESVSFFGPSRYNGDVPINVSESPEIDIVVISHNHYDHLNMPTIKQIMEKVKLFVVPLGVGAELENHGVERKKIKEFDWWDEFKYEDDFIIAATPSQHFSGRGLTDGDKTLWASWVIQSSNHKIYFSGDSGYFDGFKEIGNKYGPFDITFLECGAYNEKWHFVHMYPEETVEAHIDLKGKLLHPIHWGTFDLALHPWYEPMERFTDDARTKNIKFTLPMVGETTIYGKYIPSEFWWEKLINKTKVISKSK